MSHLYAVRMSRSSTITATADNRDNRWSPHVALAWVLRLVLHIYNMYNNGELPCVYMHLHFAFVCKKRKRATRPVRCGLLLASSNAFNYLNYTFTCARYADEAILLHF